MNDKMERIQSRESIMSSVRGIRPIHVRGPLRYRECTSQWM